jgi:hypothetical protein
MPQAKQPTRSPARSRAFKQPAALKRLTKSLDTAQDALSELRKDTGRDVSQGAKDVYADLRTFVSNARRDTAKLSRALARDFEQAERRLAKSNAKGTSRARSASRAKRPRAASTRSAPKGRKS